MQVQSITALITPMNEKGDVDFEALNKLILWQIEQGTHGLVLCGSTGEGSLLTREEKLAIFHRAVELGKGSIQLIANIGGCSTQKSVDLAIDAENLGVDACIAIVPYYVKPTEQGCWIHFSEIAKVGLPLYVYHHPGRTGTKLSIEALLEIVRIEGVSGVKEASGDLALAQELIKEGVSLFSGDDVLCQEHLALGAKGSISIAGNVVPKRWTEFVQTGAMDQELMHLCEALILETNPQCVKYAASLLGKCGPYCRLPLLLPKEEAQAKIKKALQIVEILNQN